MDQEHWSEAKAVFLKVCEADPIDREDRLAVLCRGDEALRAEVEGLLEAHDLAARSEGAGRPQPSEDGEGPGDVIGRFKLLQEIGAGGFGTVYMAEQTEPIRRKVALKIVKLGMDTKQVVARFEAERQALAVMDHPNIAKVLDGGTTQSGRPYFVMELVKGVPLIEYCDQAGLDTKERLGLFADVCRAVQHAHQKGIIHRDLKPANVLVALHDGVPVPKVIDFGIAKALDRHLTEKTLFTEFRQIIGTPEYMAPEQAEFSNLDVDTRADIYSLGVILYELITGTKPFDFQKILERGYGEMLRTIREVDPPRPSTRLSTLGDQLPVVAKQRHTEPQQLGKLVSGDLDWIAMKALEKDRSRRYETAEAMAADVDRHLKDEPILARPPSTGYRLAKYVRRHREGVIAAAAILVALLGGTAFALAGWAQAREERDQTAAARVEAERAATESESAFHVIASILEQGGSHLSGPDATLADLLENLEQGLDAGWTWPAGVEVSVRDALATAYFGQGKVDDAVRHNERAVALAMDRYGPEGLWTLDCLGQKAQILMWKGRRAEAEALARRVVEAMRRKGDVPPAPMARALGRLATFMPSETVAQREERQRLYEEAVELVRGENGYFHPYIYFTLGHLAEAYIQEGRPKDAEDLLRQSLALRMELWGEKHRIVAYEKSRLGDLMRTMGRFPEAERLLESAVATYVEVGEEGQDLWKARNNLGCLRIAQGRFAEAKDLFEEIGTWYAEHQGENAGNTLAALSNLAGTYSELGDFDQAAEIGHRVLAAIEANGHTGTIWHATVLRGVAVSERNRRNLPASVELHQQALDYLERAYGKDHPALIPSLRSYALACADLNRHADAKRLAERGLAIVRAQEVSVPKDEVRLLWALSYAAKERGDYDDALHWAREEQLVAARRLGKDHPLVGKSQRAAADCLRRLGHDKEAHEAYRGALALLQEHYPPRHPELLTLRGDILLAARAAGAEMPVEEARSLVRDCEAQWGASGWYTLTSRRHLALALEEDHDLEQAIAVLEALLLDLERLGASEPEAKRSLPVVRIELAEAWGAQGRFEEAADLAAVAVEETRALVPPPHPRELGLPLAKLADLEWKAGREADALAHQREGYAVLRDAYGVGSPLAFYMLWDLIEWSDDAEEQEALIAVVEEAVPELPASQTRLKSYALTVLGAVYLDQDRVADAEPVLREALGLRMAQDPRPWIAWNTQSLLGESISKQGRYADAEPLLLEAWENLAPLEAAHARAAEALERIVALYEAWEKPDRAATWRAKQDEAE